LRPVFYGLRDKKLRRSSADAFAVGKIFSGAASWRRGVARAVGGYGGLLRCVQGERQKRFAAAVTLAMVTQRVRPDAIVAAFPVGQANKLGIPVRNKA